MPLFHLIIVAIVQGVTEFLPISSSGHLILLPHLTGMADQGQMIDVAVHVGTLFAVILYFRHDVAHAAAGFSPLLRGQTSDDSARLLLALTVATIPVVLVGLVFSVTGFSDTLRSVTLIGWTTLLFGLFLYWADHRGSQERRAEDWTLAHAFKMGLWQVLALVPGTSRSGITISGARLLGYDRQDAARLAMLMSIPTIAAAGLLLSAEVMLEGNVAALREAAIVAVFAFGAALLALHLMMRLLESVSYTPYVIYRIALGLILLTIAYT